jgi:exodeoxyribonuclease V beta subunit
MNALDVKTTPLDKKVLIEAGAGTGKTYTIGLLVLRLLLEKNIKIEKIVLITFTEAATLELKKNTSEKIREAYNIWKNGTNEENDLTEIIKNAKKENGKIKEANLLDAIARIDEMPVFTIHGFCRKLLTEFAFETGNFEEKEVVTDIDDIKYAVIADFWRENVKNLDVLIGLNLWELSRAVDEVFKHPNADITGEDYNENQDEKVLKYAIAHKLAKEIRARLQEEKRKHKIMDFNDMIEDCHKAIERDSEKILKNAVNKRYDAIMVDEFQDTDKIQFEIFDYLFENKLFFMIGDPKQAIYRFRGGDIVAYKKARESAGENQFSMIKNYRSEKTLLDAFNVFFGNSSFAGKMGEGIDYVKVECGKPEQKPIKEEKDSYYAPFVIWKGRNNENKESFAPKAQKAVISEIKRLLSIEGIEPKDIVILLNSNRDCFAYKNALAKEGIYAIFSGGSVFSGEAADFLRILLNAICYNSRTGFIRALLAHDFIGFEPDSIDDNVFITWANIIFNARTQWEKFGVMNAVDFFLTKQNLWSLIAASPNGERSITNIRQIMDILNQEEIKYGRVLEKINNRFAQLCNEAAQSNETEERLETDEDALKIMTFHRSKGLQFNIVFVPDVSRSPHPHKFPHVYVYYENDRQVISYKAASNDGEKELAGEAENEESARLLYVALTRAKYRVYAAYSPCYGRSKSYLREIFDDYCASNSSSNIQIEELDKVIDAKYKYSFKSENEDIKKKAKPLPGKIEPAWERTSFTGISLKLEQTEHIPLLHKTEDEPPAGKRMGTLLHSIFEDLDFDAKDDDIRDMVENKLGGYREFSTEGGEDGKARKDWIKKKVRTILNKKLGSAGPLCDIDAGNKVTELNFFMYSQNMSLPAIKEILRDKINDFEKEDLPARYIKGAIDLVFLGKDGKYYILDWKSNSLNDFSKEGMDKEAMLPHGYHLQYYIYAVALKRWLEETQEGFDFKKQFGGVYYIFIRGVTDKEDNLDGIYFADAKEITDNIIKLDNSFGRGHK